MEKNIVAKTFLCYFQFMFLENWNFITVELSIVSFRFEIKILKINCFETLISAMSKRLDNKQKGSEKHFQHGKVCGWHAWEVGCIFFISIY